MRKIFIVLQMICAAGAVASTPHAKFLNLLGTIDTPITKNALDEVSQGNAASWLRVTAIDTTARRLFRQRAVALLDFYPSEESRKVLLHALRDEYGPVRKEAIKGLQRYLDDGNVKAALLLSLEDSSVVVRKAAIRVLRAQKFAQEALVNRQIVEKDVNARRLLQQALGQ